MRRILTLVGAIATLAAGVTAAVALGAGASAPDTSTATTIVGATTAPDTSTDSTTTPGISTGMTTTTAAGATATTVQDTSAGTTTVGASAATTTEASKVWVCHHTGSWKHPYHLIHISSHALPAHTRHGDVRAEANTSCPRTQLAGTKTHGRGNEQSDKAKTKHDNPGKGDKKTETNDD